MSVDTDYWDQSFYPGMGADPVPPAFPPAIATPADGTTVESGSQVVFTGTSMPDASVIIEVWNPGTSTWSLLVGPTQATSDGVWTADPYTVDAASRLTLPVRAYDQTNSLASPQITVNVTPTEPVPEVVGPDDVTEASHDAENVVADPTTAWTPGQSALFGDGEFHWDGAAWVAGAVPEPEVSDPDEGGA